MAPTGLEPTIRRAIAGVVTVALIAAACSGGAADRLAPTVPTTEQGAPPSTEQGAPPSTDPAPPPASSQPAPPSSTTPPIPGDGYEWRVGDCFDFGRDDGLDVLPYAPYGDAALVPCEGPHTHDVYHVETVPEGAAAPFPDDLDDRVNATCSATFLDAYGLVWPDSTYSLIRYLPDEQEWEAGERYLACMLYRAADGGLVELRTEPAGGRDVAWPADRGACFTGGLRSVRQPTAVDCDAPHTFEVIAVGEHPSLPGDPFPSQSQLDGFMDEFCLDELEAFTGVPAGTVSVIPIRFGRAEWDLDYRRIRCLAFATDGGDLALVRGSFAGEWTIVGVAGGDVVTA